MVGMQRTSHRLVDLSHPIVDGMVTYPGLPGPELSDHLTRAEAEVRYGAGIPVVEHLRGLDQLPRDGFRFHAAPAPVERFGTFPVRAYAVVG